MSQGNWGIVEVDRIRVGQALTPSGWQPVTNGQLFPYASGVLGDQLAAQIILNNTDATNLNGAAFSAAPGHRAVGLEINANHLRGATAGWITGITRPLHIGRSTHVWQAELRNEQDELTCVSRITIAILAPSS